MGTLALIYLLRKYLFIQKFVLFTENYLSVPTYGHFIQKKVEANYLQPLETGSAMEASGTELPGRFAREALGGHGPKYIYIYIHIHIYMYLSLSLYIYIYIYESKYMNKYMGTFVYNI